MNETEPDPLVAKIAHHRTTRWRFWLLALSIISLALLFATRTGSSSPVGSTPAFPALINGQ